MKTLSTTAAVLLLLPALVAQGFVDVTADAGLDGAAYVVPDLGDGPGQFSGGVAVADCDGDGWDDIFHLAGLLSVNGLYHNDGDGTFTDVAAAAGVDDSMTGTDVKFADYDDDGDLDVYITTYDEYSFRGEPVQHRNVLYENDGTGVFIERAAEAGLLDTGRFGISFGDLDGDLDLDLVAADWGQRKANPVPQFFMTNDGSGTFTETTPANVQADPINGFAPAIVDFDEDGDDDVIICADFETSRIWRNDGANVWTEIGGAVPLTDENGMGSAFADYDNDGDVDWFVSSEYAPEEVVPPSWSEKTGNRLYVNDGNGGFVDMTEESGLRDGGWGWAAEFGDLDADGHLDVVHTNGYYIAIPELIPYFVEDTLRIFMNDGTGTYTDEALALGVDDIDQGRGLAIFDYDRDGRQDFLVNNNDTGLTLYRNELAQAGGWLQVELRGSTSNAYGVGAKITMTAQGMPTQYRWMLASDNYLSQSPYVEHFATGAAATVDVTVEWPSGAVTTHDGLGADQRVTLFETEPTWFDLGLGLAGATSPALSGTGPLTAGSANTLDATELRPGSTLFLVVGLSRLDAPFKGGTLVPSPLIPPLPLPTGGGALTLPFTWPAGVPAGVELFFQGWIDDPFGPKGYAATNALKGLTG